VITVTKDQFFAVIGQMDVHPRVEVASLKGRVFTSKWETPRREHIGTSHSDSYGINPTIFELDPRYARAAR
jgi:hypothetical protein